MPGIKENALVKAEITAGDFVTPLPAMFPLLPPYYYCFRFHYDFALCALTTV